MVSHFPPVLQYVCVSYEQLSVDFLGRFANCYVQAEKMYFQRD